MAMADIDPMFIPDLDPDDENFDEIFGAKGYKPDREEAETAEETEEDFPDDEEEPYEADESDEGEGSGVDEFLEGLEEEPEE